MKIITFTNAYYLKLGEGGRWEESSIKENKMRIGWRNQSLSDINSANWEVIRNQLSATSTNKGVATKDTNALKMICESTFNDIWITFYKNCLWWCRVLEHQIYQDNISKYRKVEKWDCLDIEGNRLLIIQIPGKIARLQAFRGTCCKVKDSDGLMRLINRQASTEFNTIYKTRENLYKAVESGLGKLHWKDFETLVDLLFRATGWKRISVLGETMKYSDLELEDSINKELYQVQIKSKATIKDFEYYSSNFDKENYRKLFFVVHTPDAELFQYPQSKSDSVQLVLPKQLAEMIVDLGILDWLLNKIK
jgi:hypothetical protein